MEIASAVPAEVAERLSPDLFLTDAEQVQIDRDEKEALDEIVDDLLLHGQYPGNAKNKDQRKMLLTDWVADYMDGYEVADFFSRFMTATITQEQIEDETKNLEKHLRDWLKGEEIVKQRAREIAFEREDV